MLPENSLKEIQRRIDTWISTHGGYWAPLSMTCAIMEELGEVAREINSLEGFKPKKDAADKSKLGEELADLIFSIICLANHYHINLSEEIEKTLLKYSVRDSNRFTR